ncbi:MAG: 5-methyltetrahydropteroyltriglutamate--homocysteine S-methyltransferase, partial [Candidatus Dormibacteraeota bacterium]|nr:5-methyltetrahydropteroyltriglutamate--homocysteine S-methyltransferase [Candidatus Dormibacteraeota bacterium]
MSTAESRRLQSSNLGYPRIGRRRELKWMLEGYWHGKLGAEELLARAKELRRERWVTQSTAGIDLIPSGDFSLYDHVLDMSMVVGAIPERFSGLADQPLDLMFAMARGTAGKGGEVAALEMTKWFDTNYHYLVPELEPRQEFALRSTKPIDEFKEAKGFGIETRPVVLGPVSYLCLAKGSQPGFSPLSLLDRLLPVYAQLLHGLADAGASWVQMDEPCLAQDAPVAVLEAVEDAYALLRRSQPAPKIMVASYFAGLGPNLQAALMLPVDAIHLDLVRGGDDLPRALELAPDGITLSLGLVDGRNVWSTDPDPALRRLERAVSTLGPDRVIVAPSCSLMYVPVSVRDENLLDPEIRSWLAFAEDKLTELVQ